ncbi:hypothetical protein AX17_001706 [Amanita inopinata Kibby_2008]|nr:hypothetical protein AX17_001706 [Amanita inopinata Kibby_2008]
MDHRRIAREVYDLANSDDSQAPLVKEALGVIDQCIDTHGQENVSLSFNGGKDCTVLLHLYTAALARRLDPAESPKPIPAIYIAVPSPFPVLEEFIEKSTREYGLDMYYCCPPDNASNGASCPTVGNGSTPDRSKTAGISVVSGGMKQALQVYKSAFPNITAILIGTRRTDPHGASLSHRNMTDPGWPSYERVNPIINWSYSDVWNFLRKLNIPYCHLQPTYLFDSYTSLGSTYNTYPNPALLMQPCPEPRDAQPPSSVPPGRAFSTQVKAKTVNITPTSTSSLTNIPSGQKHIHDASRTQNLTGVIIDLLMNFAMAP